jgi:hypothetical protein
MNEYASLARYMHDGVIGYAIDCGPGWKTIVFDCHNELLAIDPDYKILQIKQKFNGLRYYFTSDSDRHREMLTIAQKYETLSFSIDEQTGVQVAPKDPDSEIERLNVVILNKTADNQYYQALNRETY